MEVGPEESKRRIHPGVLLATFGALLLALLLYLAFPANRESSKPDSMEHPPPVAKAPGTTLLPKQPIKEAPPAQPTVAPQEAAPAQPATAPQAGAPAEAGATGTAAPAAPADPQQPAASGPVGTTAEESCRLPLPPAKCTSEEQPDPAVGVATPGQRVRMPAYQDMEYQLFLPKSWRSDGTDTYPVVLFLHGAGDGKFSVMNSQSLPRLLVKDQSTCFDPRTCWCLDDDYTKATAKKEAPRNSSEAFLNQEEDLASPMAACDFAENFQAIVVMPQGWLPQKVTGWSEELFTKVKALTKSLLATYRGDSSRVVLVGQSAGGAGAWSFSSEDTELWSAAGVICMPGAPEMSQHLEGLDIWVVGWTGDGENGNDEMVSALKRRKSGETRYTRYTKAPAPPDPLYRSMLNHASYDLIFRDPRFWRWAFSKSNAKGPDAWK